MQRRKFLFEPSNLTRQTSTNLFEKSDFTLLKVSNARAFSLPQLKLCDRQQLDGNSNVLATPPMEKKSVPTPQAPVKNRALSRKVDLKPKKLQYSEDELGAHSVPDSGVSVRFDRSSDSLLREQNTVNCKKRDPPQKPTRRLRSGLDKIKIQTDDKENDSSVVKSTPNARNNVAQTSVGTQSAFNPYAEELSLRASGLDWKEALEWLQARRDIGLWIECCRRRCKKWRYTDDYHDPSDVPKLWYCDMNSDKSTASCSVPQFPVSPEIEKDIIYNAYNAGSIVWARLRGFPWWPGIVTDCPETLAYYQLRKKSLKPFKYYVIFFNEDKLEYAWIPTKDLKPFKSIQLDKLVKKTKYHGVEYESLLKRSCVLAKNALKLSIAERLHKFSYLRQCDKFHGDNDNNGNESDDVASAMDLDTSNEIIHPSPTSKPSSKHMKLKEFCFNYKQRQLDRNSATMNQNDFRLDPLLWLSVNYATDGVHT